VPVDRSAGKQLGRPRAARGWRPAAPPSPTSGRAHLPGPPLAERERLELIDMSVELAPGRGLRLANPIMVASGNVRHGVEYGDVVDVQRIGAICCKGNDTPGAGGQSAAPCDRDAGWDAELDRPPEPRGGRRHREVRRDLAGWQVPVIVNVAGESIEDYVEVGPAARRRARGCRHRVEHQLSQRRARAACSSPSTKTRRGL